MGIYRFGITPSSQKAEKTKYEIRPNTVSGTYNVYVKGASEPLSKHDDCQDARAAIKRYEAADKRRAK